MPAYVPYLTLDDYLPVIQRGQLSDQLLDILQDGDRERKKAESWALDKIKGRIGVIYDLDQEFTPTLPFSMSTKYGAGSRCILDYPNWSSAATYSQNDCVIQNGVAYVALQDSPSSTWDDSQWQSIGNQFEIFSIAPPAPIFSLDVKKPKAGVFVGLYKVGDIVCWNNHTWKCKVPTSLTSQQVALNFPTYSSIPNANVYPNIGPQYWEDLGEYSILGKMPNELDDNEVLIWQQEDNRNPSLVQAVVDLTLFQLHKRISPMNIPKLRIEQMQSTFEWLDSVKSDEELIPLTENPQEDIHTISWGSKPKHRNGY